MTGSRAAAYLDRLLREAAARRASDVFLQVGQRPRVRVDQAVLPLEEYPAVTPELMRALLDEIMPERIRAHFERHLDADLSYRHPEIGRFRVNAYHQRGAPALVLRRIPKEIPTLQELGLPQDTILSQMRDRGLFLVTGPTGSGKSTTLAAIIDYYNRSTEKHIVTIEDPIEYEHASRRSLVSQREIGADTEDWNHALRAALRESPDIIMVGELRDPESISLALTAAETGHLVLGTLHTRDATSAVERIVDSFQDDRKAQVRAQLALSLIGVLAQRLLPRRGGGVVLAYELLWTTDAIANSIREGKIPQIRSYMQGQKRVGMREMDESLADLVRRGLITFEIARAAAVRPDRLQTLTGPRIR